jgi:hypothetical protein
VYNVPGLKFNDPRALETGPGKYTMSLAAKSKDQGTKV